MNFSSCGKYEVKEIEKKPFEPNKYDWAKNKHEWNENNPVVRYLADVRGLDEKLIMKFHRKGLIDEMQFSKRKDEEKMNIPCVLFNHNLRKACKGGTLQGTQETPEHLRNGNERPFLKHILANSDGDTGFSFDCGYKKDINKIVLCESPIDLISYYELHKESGDIDHARMVSMGGLKMSVFTNALKDLADDDEVDLKKNGMTVVLAVDNDKGGKEFIDKFIYESEVDLPQNAKDWNEELLQTKDCGENINFNLGCGLGVSQGLQR
jgi:hypothetical protein